MRIYTRCAIADDALWIISLDIYDSLPNALSSIGPRATFLECKTTRATVVKSTTDGVGIVLPVGYASVMDILPRFQMLKNAPCRHPDAGWRLLTRLKMYSEEREEKKGVLRINSGLTIGGGKTGKGNFPVSEYITFRDYVRSRSFSLIRRRVVLLSI